MNPGKAGNTVAAVLLTAAVVLTAGCSSGGDDGDDRSGKKPSAAKSSPPAPDTAPPEGKKQKDKEKAKSGEPEKSKGPEKKTPTVPKAELTPATGSFTAKQKEYLVGRVPKGMEPAAFLESGQAACRRIGYTAKADRKAAISALKSGEIGNAEAAVEHLCPKYGPLLKDAGLGN